MTDVGTSLADCNLSSPGKVEMANVCNVFLTLHGSPPNNLQGVPP